MIEPTHSKKYARQIGSFLQGSGWKFQKMFELPPPRFEPGTAGIGVLNIARFFLFLTHKVGENLNGFLSFVVHKVFIFFAQIGCTTNGFTKSIFLVFLGGRHLFHQPKQCTLFRWNLPKVSLHLHCLIPPKWVPWPTTLVSSSFFWRWH